MFSGIIEGIGKVRSFVEKDGHRVLTIASPLFASTTKIGDSICVSGVCLTVTSKQESAVPACAFDVGAETLLRTTLGSLSSGADVNIEQSLKVGDRLHGHIVLGHVDSVATVLACEPEEAGSYRVDVEIPRELKKFIAAKGSIAIDGVSLTVNEVTEKLFRLCIIPHTWNTTTLHSLRQGLRVNVEGDCLARYVEQCIRDKDLQHG